MSSEIAVILAASLLGMIASVYIHKTPDATAGSRVGRIGKVRKAAWNNLERGFGSALQEPMITSQTGRMEFLMRTRGSLMVLMIFIPIFWKEFRLIGKLMYEADVFLQKRSELTLERNRLVTVFLRKLKYFNGILFLTTNLVYQFNDAILNRIHLIMKYEELNRGARKTIMLQFLEMAKAEFGDEDLVRLAKVKLNGRQVSVYTSYKLLLTDHLFQIRNTVAIAHALAVTSAGNSQ
jgi:hypothetical protein